MEEVKPGKVTKSIVQRALSIPLNDWLGSPGDMPDPSPVLASGSPFAASEALYLLYFPVVFGYKVTTLFKSLVIKEISII